MENVTDTAALIDSILAQIAADVAAHEVAVAERKAANAADVEVCKARAAAKLAAWEPLR